MKKITLFTIIAFSSLVVSTAFSSEGTNSGYCGLRHNLFCAEGYTPFRDALGCFHCVIVDGEQRAETEKPMPNQCPAIHALECNSSNDGTIIIVDGCPVCVINE